MVQVQFLPTRLLSNDKEASLLGAVVWACFGASFGNYIIYKIIIDKYMIIMYIKNLILLQNKEKFCVLQALKKRDNL